MPADWTGPDGNLGRFIEKKSKKTLESYRIDPDRISEDANAEDALAGGGYANRQLLELVQNSTDALAGTGGGRIRVKLTRSHLYCADNGLPIDEAGVKSLMHSRLSPKRGHPLLGRYGLGFKSVLNVTDEPEFFSRPGSFRFDRSYAQRVIQRSVPTARRWPTLRVSYPINPKEEFDRDRTLQLLAVWSTNIVRLPLTEGAFDRLSRQIRDFPPEFLLFVQHIHDLIINVQGWDTGRVFSCKKQNGQHLLTENDNTSVWTLFAITHALSDDARADSRDVSGEDSITLTWAVPLARLNEPGYFWKYFPTMIPSLVAGKLNAQWKTHEDRLHLLSGHFNSDLIHAAATLIADSLSHLMTGDDPARHLDALPHEKETGKHELTGLLQERLFSNLATSDIVPDQEGKLRRIRDISYPPRDLPMETLQVWASYRGRPPDWAHHTAAIRTRPATIDMIFQAATGNSWSSASRATISEWLEALVQHATTEDESIQASKAAIQTAASIPRNIRQNQRLGKIVFTGSGEWQELDRRSVFINSRGHPPGRDFVHPDLQANDETLRRLEELGIGLPPSDVLLRQRERRLYQALATALDHPRQSHDFWTLSRESDLPSVVKLIRGIDNWYHNLHVLSLDGKWQRFSHSLLPGPIVPSDGSRDSHIAIDTSYHREDMTLLKNLGAVDSPQEGFDYETLQPKEYGRFRDKSIREYKRKVDGDPQVSHILFDSDTTITSGPFIVLELLSKEGQALYTEQMLALEDTFTFWKMYHDSRDKYPRYSQAAQKYPILDFASPAVNHLLTDGHIMLSYDVACLSDGVGDHPKNRDVRRWLLAQPNSRQIREAFGITIGTVVESEGTSESRPLIDEWPGLKQHLNHDQSNLDLVRCDRLVADGEDTGLKCFTTDTTMFLRRGYEEDEELSTILGELELSSLPESTVGQILRRETRADIAAACELVRSKSTDVERLLAAVGEEALRQKLPRDLVLMLDDEPGLDRGLRMATSAIAIYDVGALREYREFLGHLDPPKQWAGQDPEVRFVRSLGFSPDWAGQRKSSKETFVDVDGPLSLPPLKSYQEKIVRNLMCLLEEEDNGRKRGLIRLPTGSGKTRVAVQGIVDAIKEGVYKGGVLWIADRAELCEQAVEAWRQVWSNRGSEATSLRISRLWESRKNPAPVSGQHVIVASIQTLNRRRDHIYHHNHEFLADFGLVVFDEAHRSIAPSFTRVMGQLGLKFPRRIDEPFLLGLTATPYRGRNQEETERLVNRYGGNRLDKGVFASDDAEAVTRELQETGILAQADHLSIKGGRFSLRDHELQKMRDEKLPWPPRRLEIDMALDQARTARIVEAYNEHIRGRGWPTLIFATSVDHAKTLAALLGISGVRARSVDAKTRPAVRKNVVKDFRDGSIEVLVNYGIFQEGFDAPRTRAIIVARPVWSPNLYFQMIGRGLRGPKMTGGTDRCLILNVEDNIDNYEEKLAFTELDWLWATTDR